MGNENTVNTIKTNKPFVLKGGDAKKDVSISPENPEKGGNKKSPQGLSKEPLRAVNDNPSSANPWRAALQELPAKAWNNLPEDPTGIWKQLEAKWADGGGDTAKKAAALAAFAAALGGVYFVGKNAHRAASEVLPPSLLVYLSRAARLVVTALRGINVNQVSYSEMRKVADAFAEILQWAGRDRDMAIKILTDMRPEVGLETYDEPFLIRVFDAFMGRINVVFYDPRLAAELVMEDLGIERKDNYSNNSVLGLSGAGGLVDNPSESLLNGASKTLLAIALTTAAKSIDFKNALDSVLPDSVKEPLNRVSELLETYKVPQTLVLNTLYYTIMLSNPVSGLARAIGIEAAAQLLSKGPTQLSQEALETITHIKEQAEKIASNPGEAANHTLRTLDGFIKSLTGSVESLQLKESA